MLPLTALHLVFVLAQIVYPYLTWNVAPDRRERSDRVVLAVFLAVWLHWMCVRNECILSLVEKRQVDPAYEPGRCPHITPLAYSLPHDGVFVSLLLQSSFVLILWPAGARAPARLRCVRRMRGPTAAQKVALGGGMVTYYLLSQHYAREASAPHAAECKALEDSLRAA